MSRRVARRRPVGAARHVQHAPQRLARHRHEQVAARAARHLGERAARGRARARAPPSRWPSRTRSRRTAAPAASSTRYSRFGARCSRQPCWIESSSRSIPTTRALGQRCAQRCTSTPSPQPTSSSESGAASDEQLVRAALEAAHQAAHERVARPVLVVGVAGDDPVAGDGDAAHSLTVRPRCSPRASSRLAGAPSALGRRCPRRPRIVSARGLLHAGARVRSGRARRRARARSGGSARSCAGSSRAGPRAGRRSRPSAHSTIAAMNSTAPRISDCTCPLPLPSA